MIPDSGTHFWLMFALVAYSVIRKSDLSFVFTLCVYSAAWQVSDYLSFQPEASLLLKLFFQTSVSITLIYAVTNLRYTRFTGLFVGLLLFGIASFFVMIMLDKFATSIAFNQTVEIFTLINIQLIYLELLALAGISFDMGNDKGILRRSVDDDLRGSVAVFSFLGDTEKGHSMVQEQKGN